MNKKIPCLFLLLSFKSFGELPQAALRVLGISMPSGCSALEKNRCRSARSYDETKKDMRGRLSKLKHLTVREINLPHLRATSYINNDKNSAFLAINIYLNVQSGLTEIFLVENEHQR